MTSIEHGELPPNDITKDDIIKSIRDAQTALQSAGTNLVKYRTIIKAQAARIAELEEYVARLERVIGRSQHHLVAGNKAVALNMLRAYIATEKEYGKDERDGHSAVPRSREARPDFGPAARGKSQLINAAEQLRLIWKEGQRPELELAFTQERRGVRYLKLIEQLGEDATTFRAWWPNT